MSQRLRKNQRLLCLIAALMIGSPTFADPADGESKASGAGFQPPPIEVPPGFTVELVAGPPLVKYPMMAAFDERGRLFIAESDGQNLGKAALLEQRPRFVRMIEDTDADGTFDKSTIYADKLVMPEGALWHNGTFFIMSAPHLWRLDDADGDGVADHREPLVGEMDLIGNANQHGPYLTPAGRLLFSGGTFGYNLVGQDGKPPIKGNFASVFSCTADGTDVRVESHAGINPVEVEFTEEGEMLGTCAIFDRVGGRCDSLVHWVHGGTYAERLREPILKQTGRFLPAAVRWGQVAPAGLVRMRGAHFGEEFQGQLFACLFNTHELIRIRLERTGATFRGEHEAFLRSPSSDFHPADVLEDADGSLLLVDTGAWLTMGCPTSKDGAPGGFGGIYRIRRSDGPALDDPRGVKLEWDKASTAELAARLDDPRPTVRDRAISELVRRKDQAVATVAAASTQGNSPQQRRNAVWALARIGTASARRALCAVLTDNDPSVRQAAVHAVGIVREPAALDHLGNIVVNDELPIRREAATALGLIGQSAAVNALLKGLRTARDEFLEHALIYALIEAGEASEVEAGLVDTEPRVQRGALIALDQIAGDRLTRAQVTPLLATSDSELRQATLSIVAKHPAWADEIIGLLHDALRAAESTPEQQALIAGAVPAFADNAAVQAQVADALSRTETPIETLSTLLSAIGRLEQPRLPEPWLVPMSRLLSHRDVEIRRQLLSNLAPFEVRFLDQALRTFAGDLTQPEALRVAALALRTRHGLDLEPAEFQLLVARLNPDAAPLERLAAANALAAAKLSDGQLISLVIVVRHAGALELPALLRAFESAVKSEQIPLDAARAVGRQLVEAVAESAAAQSLPPARLQAVFSGFPPEIAAAAQRQFPDAAVDADEQTAKLSALIEELADGNAESGQQLFFSNRLACAGCHRIKDRGGLVGPDLSQIARIRSPRHLAEAVLLPSATLANGFESYSLATDSGRTLTGLIRRESATAVHLVSTDGTEVRVPRDEIEEIAPSSVSIMPQGLDKQLSREQLRDLIAFLRTLK